MIYIEVENIGCMCLPGEELQDEETVHDESQEDIAENQCHLCMKMIEKTDQLMNHFQVDHSQFYNTMMKTTYEKLVVPRM